MPGEINMTRFCFILLFLGCSQDTVGPSPKHVKPAVHQYVSVPVTVAGLEEAVRRAKAKDHLRGDGTVAIFESGDSLTVFLIAQE